MINARSPRSRRPGGPSPARVAARTRQAAPVVAYLLLALAIIAVVNGWIVPATSPHLTVGDVVAVEGTDAASVYLTVRARGNADQIVGATSPAAGVVILHGTDDDGIMTTTDHLDIPRDGELAMHPGGTHLMLNGLLTPLVPKSVVKIRLLFRSSPPMDIEAGVVAYDQVPELFPLQSAAPR